MTDQKKLLKIILNDYLQSSETINGKTSRHIPRYLFRNTGANYQRIYNSHGILYDLIRDERMPFYSSINQNYKFRGFAIIRNSLREDEFLWTSSFNVIDGSITMRQDLQDSIMAALSESLHPNLGTVATMD